MKDLIERPMADLDEKLKPCPHCGGCCAKIVPIRDGYRAHCTKCGAAGGAEFYGPGDKPSARERAIAAWNRRAYLDATQAQAQGVVEGAMRQVVSLDLAQYLLACTRRVSNGAAKAFRHEALTVAYVAAVRNCTPDQVRRRYVSDYRTVHDTTAREVTDRLDAVAGFDLENVDEAVIERFFQSFHKSALASLSPAKGSEGGAK